MEAAVKSEEGVEKVEAVQEVLTDVTSTVIEEKEVSAGWKFPTSKIQLFPDSEVETQSSVDESIEAAPQTIAKTILQESKETISIVKTEIPAYETDKEKPTDHVDIADTKAEISVSKGKVKTLEEETESDGWKFLSFRLPAFPFFGSSEAKEKDASIEVSPEVKSKRTTETDLVTEVVTTKTDTGEIPESITKSDESVYITKTRVESVVVGGQEKSVEEMESAWKVSLSSFQVPVLFKAEQSDSFVSKTVSVSADTDRRDLVTEVITTQERQEAEPVQLDSAFDVPSTKAGKTDITEVGEEKVYTEKEKSEAPEEEKLEAPKESPIPKKPDMDKEPKYETVTDMVDVDEQSPTEWSTAKKHKKKITKVEKTITTVQTAGVETISPTLELDLTTPKIETVDKESAVKEVSPHAQIKVSIYEEYINVRTPEAEPVMVESDIKTEEGVGKSEAVEEVSSVLTEVTFTVAEAEEVSFGWTLPTLKIPLFGASDVRNESSVDGPIEAAPQTVSEISEAISIVKAGMPAYETDNENADMADTKAEISVFDGEVKTAKIESDPWKLPSVGLQKRIGTSELKEEDASKEISPEADNKITTETELVREFTTTKTDTSEIPDSITRSEESVYITKTRVESVVEGGQEKSVEEMESAWKVSLSSFQVPVLSRAEQSDSFVSKTVFVSTDTGRRDLVTEVLTAEERQEMKTVQAESTFEVPATEIAEITEIVTVKIEDEKSEVYEQLPIPQEPKTDKELSVEIQEIVSQVVDVDKESPTEGVTVTGKVQKHKKKITMVEKSLTTVQTSGVGTISPNLELDLTTSEIESVAEKGNIEEISPETQVTVSIYEEEVKVSAPGTETIVTIKTEKDVEKVKSVHEASTVLTKVTSTVLEEERQVSSKWTYRTASSVEEPTEVAPQSVAEASQSVMSKQYGYISVARVENLAVGVGDKTVEDELESDLRSSLTSVHIPVQSKTDSVVLQTVSYQDEERSSEIGKASLSAEDGEVKDDSPETKVIVINKEDKLQVSSSESSMLKLSLKSEDDKQRSEYQQGISTLSAEQTATPLKISMEELEADEIVTDPKLKVETQESVLDIDSTEKMDKGEESGLSQGAKISCRPKSAMISTAKLGVSVIAESINITSKDTEGNEPQLSEKDPASARRLKYLREGKVKFYSTDITSSHQETTADQKASDLSGSERRRRIRFPQLSLPGFGVTVLQESISMTDEDSPTTDMSFTDKMQRSFEAVNFSPSKEGASDTSSLHTRVVSDAIEAKQDASIELQLNKDLLKTIDSINLKVQQLKLDDEEYEHPDKVPQEFQISKLPFDISTPKTKLGTGGVHERELLSQAITGQVLSAEESGVALKMPDVIQTQTSKTEGGLDGLTRFSGLSDTTESIQDASLDASIVAQSPATESTRIHFPQFSTPKLSVAIMGESIHMGDDDAIKTKLDDFMLEENAQSSLSEEKEMIKTASEASESSGWKFQMPSFKMNIFGKTDKKSDSSPDSGRSAPGKTESVLQEDAENRTPKADHDKQPPVEEKPRSPFKLPSFKLPSLTLRGKKEKSESLSIDVPDTDKATVQEELHTEIERNQDTGKLEAVTESRTEGEHVKTGLFSTKGEKMKLPKLELSKPSVKVSTGSTNLVAESLDAKVSQVTGSKGEIQEETTVTSPGSPGVLKMERSEIHVKIMPELAEKIKIEFPYFKTPAISAFIPQDYTSEIGASPQEVHYEVHTTEMKDEHVISKIHKTPLHKTKAMSGHIPEDEDEAFVSEELKDISISSQQEVSGAKIKPRKAIKLSFSKVKMPVLTLSASREKESFDITSRHEGSGLDLPEYDLSSKDEFPAVDITCVANQSVQDITEALESSDTVDAKGQTDEISLHQKQTTASEKEKTRENIERQCVISTLESASLKEQEKVIKRIIQVETASADSSTSLSKSQSEESHEVVKLSHISYIRLGAPSPEAVMETTGKSDLEIYSDSSSGDIRSEYDNVSPEASKPKSETIKATSFSSEIVKEYEISTSEIPAYGFSLLKVKLPEVSTSITTKDLENTISDDQSKSELSGKINTETSQFPETRLEISKVESVKSDLTVSPEVHVEKLKTFTFEVKSPTQIAAVSFPIHARDASVVHSETTEPPAPNNQQEQMSVKEKEALPKSPSKFRFWVPSIGFSSSLEEKESKKVDQEEKKPDVSKPEKELSSSKEKVPWYKFPKLGLSSTEKQKSEDKETVKRPEASSTLTETENIEEQTTSVAQGAQATLAEPEDFKLNDTDLDESGTKSAK